LFGISRRVLTYILALGSLCFSTVYIGIELVRIFPLSVAAIANIEKMYLLSLGASILLSPLLSVWLGRWRLLKIWCVTTLTVTSAAFIPELLNAGEKVVTCYAIVFGVLIGFGIPSLLSLLADITRVEERGRVGGMMLFLSLPTLIIVKFLSSRYLSVGVVGFILFEWLLIALILMYGRKSKVFLHRREKPPVHVSSLRHFMLYVTGWIIYCIVINLMTKAKLNISDILSPATIDFMDFIENVVISIFAPIGGVILDRFGRRRIVWMAFCLLGLGYASLGINPFSLVAWIIYVIVDGIALSLFFMIFIFIIWADISEPSRPDLFFALGCPYLFLFSSLSDIIDISAYFEPTTIFFIAFFLMFLSTIPMAFTIETLPSRFIWHPTIRTRVMNIFRGPRRRKRLAVYADMLMAIRRAPDGRRFTHVMNEANLSSTRLRERLSELEGLRLIEYTDDGKLLLTEDGEKFLAKLKDLRDR